MTMTMKNLMLTGACCAVLFGCSGGGSSSSSSGSVSDGGTMDASVPDAGGTCTLSTDGGNGGANPCDSTQYCDTTSGLCVKRCDAATAPTVCTAATQACSPATGMCIPRCDIPGTPITCAAPEVCTAATGLCGAACVDATCLPTEKICNDGTNGCDDPTTATSCTYATTRAVPSRVAGGPIVYSAQAIDGVAADDTANCPGGGYCVFIQFKYTDPTGDAETANLCSFTPPNGSASAFSQWNDNMAGGAAGLPGCANNEVKVDAASNASSGEYKVPLCFTAASRPANFVFSIKDAAGNASNPVCLDVPAMN